MDSTEYRVPIRLECFQNLNQDISKDSMLDGHPSSFINRTLSDRTISNFSFIIFLACDLIFSLLNVIKGPYKTSQEENDSATFMWH
jgi:hypothetical protein